MRRTGRNKPCASFIGEATPDIGRVSGTSLDKGVELDALAKMAEPEREALISKAQSGETVSARSSGASKRQRAAETRDLKAEAVEKVAAQVIDHVPGEHRDALKANCYGGGMKALGDAITRLIGVSVFDNTSAGRGYKHCLPPSAEARPEGWVHYTRPLFRRYSAAPSAKDCSIAIWMMA